MPMSPRWIVADMLLMATFQIGNPIETVIQVVINDLARSTLRFRVQFVTCIHSTLFLRGVPIYLQKYGLSAYVPLVTAGWQPKKEDRVVPNGEGPMVDLWWAAALSDERAKDVLRSLNPNADADNIYWTLERCKKDAWKAGMCLNEFFLRNGAQAANNARAAWSETVTQNAAADPNVNYALDMKPFELLTSDMRAACLKQLFSYSRLFHGNGRVLRMGMAATS